MAKISSTARTPPRQHADSAKPAATAPTRGTRSHSRDVEPATPRRSNRTARQPSVEADVSAAGASKRSRKAQAVVVEDLPAVDEEDDEGDDADDVLAKEYEGDEDGSAPADEDGFLDLRLSGYSGTTAKTTFSAEEVAQLDLDNIVDALEDLDTISGKVLDDLMSAEPDVRRIVWKDIATAGTRAQKAFQRHSRDFAAQKEYYASPEQVYIRPDIVLRALYAVNTVEDVADDAARPDAIIEKANLARLLHAVIVEVQDPLHPTIDELKALETAEMWFPRAIAGNEWSNEAFDLSLALSAQLAIQNAASFAEDPNYDPQGVATSTFYEVDDEGTQNYRHELDLNMDQLPAQHVDEALDRVAQLVNELKKPFHSEEPAVAIQVLRAQFPWSDLITAAEDYYITRRLQLEGQIAALGGVKSLTTSLQAMLQEKSELSQLRSLRTSIGAGTTPKKTANISDIKAAKAAYLAASRQTAPAQAPAPTAPMVVVSQPGQQAPNAAGQDDYHVLEDEPAVNSPSNARMIAQLSAVQDKARARNVSGNRARSFLDPQAGATREQWTDPQPSQASQQQPIPVSSSNIDPALRRYSPGKRPREEGPSDESWDPTQDEGFTQGNIDTAAADARRAQARRLQHQPRPSASARPAGPSPQRPRPNELRAPKRQRKNPGSAIPIEPIQRPDPDAGTPPQPTPYEQYENARVLAKMTRLNVGHTQQSRVRQPWGPEETQQLLSLIETNDGDGISWAALKARDREDDNILGRRTAEDLRFKARNMKVELVLSEIEIHENWRSVVLGKKEIEKLSSRGIPYYQDRIRAVDVVGIDG
ncbi:hypothetical protein LTR95_008112 [Oleoguttula sp. CCFEE 5521]